MATGPSISEFYKSTKKKTVSFSSLAWKRATRDLDIAGKQVTPRRKGSKYVGTNNKILFSRLLLEFFSLSPAASDNRTTNTDSIFFSGSLIDRVKTEKVPPRSSPVLVTLLSFLHPPWTPILSSAPKLLRGSPSLHVFLRNARCSPSFLSVVQEMTPPARWLPRQRMTKGSREGDTFT